MGDSLTEVFSSLNHNMNGDIEFSTADIRIPLCQWPSYTEAEND